jgi:hypothetical protein
MLREQIRILERRLYPGAEKLLRSGAKLQLSRMTLTVKFSCK